MSKKIYLTFDDGPNDPYTSQILDILDKHHAKATFFVIGKNAERNPELIKRMVGLGHAIGVHTYSHNPLKVLTGNLFGETRQTRQIIENICGVSAKIYRSPWGITVPWFKSRLRQGGYKIFHWDIMAHDWWQPNPEFIAQHIVSRAFDGAIVLLHDGDQLKSGSRHNTVEATKIILEKLTESGYVFEALYEDYKRPTKFNGMAIDNLQWTKYATKNSPNFLRSSIAALLLLTLMYHYGFHNFISKAYAMERSGSTRIAKGVHRIGSRMHKSWRSSEN